MTVQNVCRQMKRLSSARKIISKFPMQRTKIRDFCTQSWAHFCLEKYGIENEEILRSIESHTTGRPNMSLLDKIIYIADYIEPGRDVAPNLPEVRALAFVDIDACLYRILEDTLAYLAEKGATLDPATEETFLYYKNLKNSDSEKEDKN